MPVSKYLRATLRSLLGNGGSLTFVCPKGRHLIVKMGLFGILILGNENTDASSALYSPVAHTDRFSHPSGTTRSRPPWIIGVKASNSLGMTPKR